MKTYVYNSVEPTIFPIIQWAMIAKLLMAAGSIPVILSIIILEKCIGTTLNKQESVKCHAISLR